MIRQSTLAEQEKYDKDRILHINFNQDQGFFCLIKLNLFSILKKDVLSLELKVDFVFIILSH